MFEFTNFQAGMIVWGIIAVVSIAYMRWDMSHATEADEA